MTLRQNNEQHANAAFKLHGLTFTLSGIVVNSRARRSSRSDLSCDRDGAAGSNTSSLLGFVALAVASALSASSLPCGGEGTSESSGKDRPE
jgi:hypothetical protein